VIKDVNENSDQRIFDKIREFGSLEDKTVLEVGCGNGRISSLMADKTKRLIGIDPDDETIRQAHRNIPGEDFMVASGENLAFKDEVFDLVIFTLSLHHQNGKKAISEANRVLRREGLILVVEPILGDEIEGVFAIVHDEKQEISDAQRAISECELSIVGSQTFSAHWVFENKEELSDAIFNYYELPFDAEKAQKIYDFLGRKADHQPLELSDRMIIQSLSKKVVRSR
jgi:ubiquinone/menaquinone biosynthesis C-methylase UbiE